MILYDVLSASLEMVHNWLQRAKDYSQSMKDRGMYIRIVGKVALIGI